MPSLFITQSIEADPALLLSAQDQWSAPFVLEREGGGSESAVWGEGGVPQPKGFFPRKVSWMDGRNGGRAPPGLLLTRPDFLLDYWLSARGKSERQKSAIDLGGGFRMVVVPRDLH